MAVKYKDILLFDWQDAPEEVVRQLADAVNKLEGKTFINIAPTEDDSVAVVLADRLLSGREAQRIIDEAEGEVVG